MATYTEYEIKSGKRWHVRGYLGTDDATGRQMEFNKRGFKTKKEAQISYDRAKYEFNSGEYNKGSNANLTFSQVYHEWVELYKGTVRESSFSRTFKRFDNFILPELGKYRIAKITGHILQTAVNKWAKQSNSYKVTLNYTIRVMKYAVAKEYIDDDLKNKVIVPDNDKQEKDEEESEGTVFYTAPELQEFLSLLKKQGNSKRYAFFVLLAYSGLRKGEALALTWKDIDFNQGLVHVNKTLSKDLKGNTVVNKTKNELDRFVTIDPNTLKVLKDWKHNQAKKLIGFGHNALSPKQLIFNSPVSNTFMSVTWPNMFLNKFTEEHNLKRITPHGFRHTYCSLAFEAGMPIKDVQELLGHKKMETTMNIYAHVTPQSRKKSADLFANYLKTHLNT